MSTQPDAPRSGKQQPLTEYAVSNGSSGCHYIAISASGEVYELEEDEPESGDIKKTRLKRRNGSGRNYCRSRTFTVSAAQVAMYARTGFHFVVGMDVTDAGFDILCERIMEMSPDSRVSFGAEMALQPPEKDDG